MKTPQEWYDEGVEIREKPDQFNYDGTVLLRDRFKKAIEVAEELLDPTQPYSHAHAELAYSYVREFQQGGAVNPEATLQMAEAAARKAIAIQDDFDARWSFAIVLWNKGSFVRSFQEYAIAESKFDPKRPALAADMIADRGEAQIYSGQPGVAITEIEKAIKKRTAIGKPIPYWYLWNYGRALYMAKLYSEAIDKIGEIAPPQPNDVLLITAASKAQRGQSGDLAAAKADMAAFSANDPEWSIARADERHFLNDSDRQHWLDGLQMAGLKAS